MAPNSKYYVQLKEAIDKVNKCQEVQTKVERAYSANQMYVENVKFPTYEEFREREIAENDALIIKGHYVNKIAELRSISEIANAYINSIKLSAEIKGEDIAEAEISAKNTVLNSIKISYTYSKLPQEEIQPVLDILGSEDSYEEKLNKVVNLEGDVYKNQLLDCKTRIIGDHYLLLTDEVEFRCFMSIIDDLKLTEEDLAGYEPETNLYTGDAPYMSEKIEELKKDAVDKDYIDALDKANTYLVKGIPNISKLHSKAAEGYGKLCELERRNREGKYIIDNHSDIASHLKVASSRHFQVDKKECKTKSVADYKKDIFNVVNNPKSLIAENEQKWIIDYVDKLYERGILSNDPSASEQGIKIYAFKSLSDSKTKLENAVNSGVKEDIVKATNEYGKLYSNYQASIKELKEHVKHDLCSENITVARNDNVPYEFRDDAVGNTLLDNIEIMNGYCMNNGIDVKEFIKNPFEQIKKQLENYQNTKSDIADLINDHSNVVNYLNGLEYGDKGLKATMFADVERVLNGTAYLIQDPEERVKYQASVKMFYASTVESYIKINENYGSLSDEDRREFVMNLLTQEPTEPKESFNPYLKPNLKDEINPYTGEKINVFNREEYFAKNNNLLNTFNRAVDAFVALENGEASLQNLLSDSIQKLAPAVIEKYKEKYPLVEKVVTQVQSFEAPSDNDLNTLKLLGQFEYASKTGINKGNSLDVMKSLSNMRKDYNKFGFFAKIFNGEARAQSKTLKAMMNEVAIATKQSRRSVEKACKAFAKGDTQERQNEVVDKLFTNAPEANKNLELENDISKRIPLSKEEQKEIDDLVEGRIEEPSKVEEVSDAKEDELDLQK